MSRPFSWHKYGRYVVTGLCFMYAFKGLTSLIERTPFAQRVERSNLDALFSAKTPEVSQNIFLVVVTEDDYDRLFGGISPLKPSKLNEIVQAIRESGPKVLGVDFDTAAWTDVAGPSAAGTTIVWARGIIGGPGNVTLANVLGGSPGGVCYGVPEYLPNDDGFIRQYSEYIKGASQAFPSLPLNLTEVFLKGPGACRQAIPIKEWKRPDQPLLINYTGDKYAFNRLSAGSLLQLKGAPGDPEATRRWTAWRAQNPMKGNLVLLGGAYRAARDTYPTPVGYLDGVDILAHTAQTRLPGRALRSDIENEYLRGWFSAQGVVILLLSYFIPKAWRLGIVILTGPVYAFVGGWFWFFSGGTFLSFVPYLIGLVLHQIYDHIKDFRKIEKENREFRERLRGLGVSVPESSADA